MQDLLDRFEQLPALAAAETDLVRRGRFLTVDFLVGIAEAPFYLGVVEGQLRRLERGPRLLRATAFSLRGSEVAWRAFWQAVPQPGWHDLFALSKRGELSFEGNLQPFMAHLQFIKDLLALPRHARAA